MSKFIVDYDEFPEVFTSHLTSYTNNNVIFYDRNNNSILELRENGDIFVHGHLAENDREVTDALREFINKVVVGGV